MKFVTVDFAVPDKEMEQWAQNTEHFDFTVFRFASTATMVARTSEKQIMYMGLQQPLVLGPFTTNPEATDFEVATALREIMVAARVFAQTKGIGEVYILTADENIKRLAAKLEMEELPACTAFRKEAGHI